MKYIRSSHLSWFGRGETVWLYSDLFGFVLEMSPDLKALIDWFAEPKDAQSAAEAFAAAWTQEQIGQFMSVFLQHRVLVGPEDQELDALCDMVPIKGPWILASRQMDGSITAVTSRGFGDEPWAQPQLLQLDAWQSDLWRAIDGERSVRELALALTEATDGEPQLDLGRAVVSLAAWTHSDRQLTRMLSAPRSQLPRLPPYASSTMPYPPLGEAGGDPGSARDLGPYHAEEIADAEAQFEERETTLSHLFADPHPALGGRTWGERFAEVALRRGWTGPGRAEVLEIGGGTGRFALAMVSTLLREVPDLRYEVLDLSPALHAAQTGRLADLAAASTRLGHAERLERADASVDLVISNEVIADLRIGMVTRHSVRTLRPDAGTDPEALELVEHYDLETRGAPEPVPIQVGATRVLEQLAKVLKPGGFAVLTEFGEEGQFPIESTHLDHGEWSVHFGHLMVVARKLGLTATLEVLPELMGLQEDVWVLASNRTQFRNLRFLLRHHGGDLKKRALTPEQLAMAAGGRIRVDRLEGLQFRPAGERVMGLVPKEFKALILAKPK